MTIGGLKEPVHISYNYDYVRLIDFPLKILRIQRCLNIYGSSIKLENTGY